MRAMFLAVLLLATPFVGCLGGDDGGAAGDELKSQAKVSEGTGGIQGVVTDPAIQPVVGATLKLMEVSKTATTASDGSFAFSNVVPGTYTLQVQADGFTGSENEVTVVSGEVAILDVVLAHVPSITPYMEQREFTGFVECSVRAGFGVAVCGAINFVAGGNATNDRFLFTWDIEPNLYQMVAEIQWEANQPTGQWLSFSVEPDGLPNDGKTEFGNERGLSPLVVRADLDRIREIDANATAVCDGEKDPESAISADRESYCNRNYAEEGGPVYARIFVDGDRETSPVAVGLSVQQEYHVIVTMFYNAPACEDYSIFLGNECAQEDVAREAGNVTDG